jgi:hypothetical protein
MLLSAIHSMPRFQMNNKNFPAIDQTMLDGIISLAEQREIAEDGRYPNGVTLGKTPLLPETPEAQALKSAIKALPLAEAQELHALMYLGRGGVEGETITEAIVWQREQAASRPEKDIKHSLYGKVPLASYLREGIRLAQDS